MTANVPLGQGLDTHSRAFSNMLHACLLVLVALVIAAPNSKLVNNFFYLTLLLPGLYLLFRQRRQLSVVMCLATAYLMYVALSTFWGTGEVAAAVKQLKYVLYVLAFMTAVDQLARSPGRIRWLAWLGFGLALLLEMHSLYTQIGQLGLADWWAHFPRLSETTGPLNPVYLALTIGLFGFLLIASQVRNPWIGTLLVCALILITLPLQSRTLILALIAAHSFHLLRHRHYGVLAAWLLAGMAGAAILLLSIDRFTSSVQRDDIWLFAIEAFRQDCSMLLGCGNRYDFNINIGGQYYYHSHSIALTQLLYGGLAGTLLLLALLWQIIHATHQVAAYWQSVFVFCTTACLTIGHTILTHPDFLWLLTWLPLGLSGILFASKERSAQAQLKNSGSHDHDTQLI